MVHRQRAFAAFSRRRYSPHDVGADGHGNSDHSHRVREYRKPPPGARLRQAAGNCSSPHTRRQPPTHGTSTTHRDNDVVVDGGPRRNCHRCIRPRSHASIFAARSPPAQRNPHRLGRPPLCPLYFHPHRFLFWFGPRSSIHPPCCLCHHSTTRSRSRLHHHPSPSP